MRKFIYLIPILVFIILLANKFNIEIFAQSPTVSLASYRNIKTQRINFTQKMLTYTLARNFDITVKDSILTNRSGNDYISYSIKGKNNYRGEIINNNWVDYFDNKDSSFTIEFGGNLELVNIPDITFQNIKTGKDDTVKKHIRFLKNGKTQLRMLNVKAFDKGKEINLKSIKLDNKKVTYEFEKKVDFVDPTFEWAPVDGKDTWIQSGAGANTNYGTNAAVYIGKTAGGVFYEGFIQFVNLKNTILAINGFASMDSAYIRMYCNDAGAGSITGYFSPVDSDWTELGTTYNNAPPRGASGYRTDTTVIGATGYYDFNITADVDSILNYAKPDSGWWFNEVSELTAERGFSTSDGANDPEFRLLYTSYVTFSELVDSMNALRAEWKGDISDSLQSVPFADSARAAGVSGSGVSAATLADSMALAFKIADYSITFRDTLELVYLDTFGFGYDTTGLQLYITGDHNSDTTIITDKSGKGNHGINNGATIISGDSLIGGKAISLDGGSTILTDVNVFANTDFVSGISLEALIYPTSITVDQFIMDIEGAYYLAIDFSKDNKIDFTVDGIVVDAIGNTPIILNEWNHIIGSWDSLTGISTLYVNGIEDGSASQVRFDLSDIDRAISIGSKWNGLSDFINGLGDEFRVYSYPLSTDEVSNRYHDLLRHKQLMDITADSLTTKTTVLDVNAVLSDSMALTEKKAEVEASINSVLSDSSVIRLPDGTSKFIKMK